MKNRMLSFPSSSSSFSFWKHSALLLAIGSSTSTFSSSSSSSSLLLLFSPFSFLLFESSSSSSSQPSSASTSTSTSFGIPFASAFTLPTSTHHHHYNFGGVDRITFLTTVATTTTTTTSSVSTFFNFNNNNNNIMSSCSKSQEGSSSSSSSSTALNARLRGLEQRIAGATPTVGDMTLYLKAAQDGVSVGDCPFAHFVRMVLEEKELPYEVKPCTQDTKPQWLLENYEGKMPALRHGKECYIDSSVIVEYLEFFFSKDQTSLAAPNGSETLLDGFFPAVAKYIKTIDNSDTESLETLQEALNTLNQQLQDKTFLTGDTFTVLDCRLVPQLYILYTCIEGFKDGLPNISKEYPNIHSYYERTTSRPSFQNSVYPKETCLWGWGNARGGGH